MLLLTIGIDEDGHVCQRSGFLRHGTLAQMETARHIEYLLDEMGRQQDVAELGLAVSEPEQVTGWQLDYLLAQMKAGKA